MENSKDKKQKSLIDMDVQEGNIKHDPSDPHGLKTEIEKHDRQHKNDAGSDKDQQGTDKAPGEERDKQEKVTAKDLKGKKVDADPQQESDQPAQ